MYQVDTTRRSRKDARVSDPEPAARSTRAPAWRLVLLCLLALPLLGIPTDAQAEFQTSPVTTATVGQQYVYEVRASGRGTVTITAPNGLPSWLSLVDGRKGRATLTGVPSETGTFSVLLRAEDDSCRTLTFLCDVQTFEINVSLAANAPPRVIPPGLPDRTVSVGENVEIDVAAAFEDPDGDPLVFRASGLPRGLSLSGGTISGATGAAEGSPYTVTVEADDQRGGVVSTSFTLTVASAGSADLALESLDASPAPALVGTPFDLTIVVRNGGASSSGAVTLTLELRGNPLEIATTLCTASSLADRDELKCNVEALAAGASRSLTLRASAAEAGDTLVVARLDTGTTIPADPNTGNNSASLTVSTGASVSDTPAQSFAIAGASAAAAGDVNADGFADGVVASATQATRLLLNTQTPSSLAAALADPAADRRGLDGGAVLNDGASGADVALADFDGDGALEIAVAKGAGSPSLVLRRDGTVYGTLGEPDRDDRVVAVGDIDGDGLVDAVVAALDAMHVYLNRGNGFTAAPSVAGAATRAIELANVAGTALPDLIAVTANGTGLVYTNTGGGTFSSAHEVGTGPFTSVASGDFDADGYADLVLGRSQPGPSGLPSNGVYLADGAGGFSSSSELGGASTIDVVAGDVDGDGVLDVVAVNETGIHQVFIGDGRGVFGLWPRLIVSPGARRAAIAPISRAQHPDVVFAGADRLDVFFNDGAGNLGLGDAEPPIITLNGPPEIIVSVGGRYDDPGATATDNVDGTLTPEVDGRVDPNVIGTYVVTYTAMDSAGNPAEPVTRTVRVNPESDVGGGGGGAAGWPLLTLCLVLALLRRRRPRMLVATLLGATALTGLGSRASASELSYTFVDFGAIGVKSDLTGTASPGGQVVRVVSGDGDGLLVGGSLAIGRRFYLAGSYEAAVMDVDAVISSPLLSASVNGNYDLIATRAAFGYIQPIGEKLDLLLEIGEENLEYDFGSFAGESFDASASGASLGVGLRFNPRPALEVFGMARESAVGRVNLTTHAIDSGPHLLIGVRWNFFEDLGVAVQVQHSDHADSLNLTMRFGFRELRVGH